MVFKKYGKVMLSSIIFVVFTAITGYSIGMTYGKNIGEDKAIVKTQESMPKQDSSIPAVDGDLEPETDNKNSNKKEEDKKKKENKIVRRTPSNNSGGGRTTRSKPSSGGTNVSIPNKLKDGEYFGESNGFAGPVKVKVVVSGGKIKEVSVVSHTETPSYFEKAVAVASKIVSAQNTNVDSVSGATITSDAIKRAVGQALKNAGDSTGGGSNFSTSDNSAKVVELNKKIEELNKKIQELSLQKGDVNLGELKDGKYEGEGQGFKGKVRVSVTIEKGKIKSIDILDNGGDDAPYFDKAKALIEDVISKQTTKVDSVSGSTYSSNGIKLAINSALRKAGGSGGTDDSVINALNANINKLNEKIEELTKEIQELNFEKDDIDFGNLKNGKYEGEGQGFKGKIRVSVKIESGKIKSVDILDNGGDDAPYFDKAKTLIENVITNNTTKVDSVSGSTYSSKGIISAINSALKKATSNSTSSSGENKELNDTINKLNSEVNLYKEQVNKLNNELKTYDSLIDLMNITKTLKDGVYDGKSKGYEDREFCVRVVVENSRIKSVEVTNSTDDAPFLNNAKTLIPKIIELNSPGVDVVTNATFSSNGIINGVRDALKNAYVVEDSSITSVEKLIQKFKSIFKLNNYDDITPKIQSNDSGSTSSESEESEANN